MDGRPSYAADILTISGNPTLSLYLSGLFQKSGWKFARAETGEAGVSFLQNKGAVVAVCEETLPDGAWHDAAAGCNSIPHAPALIVVSDDSSLGGEVAALGGFDVLTRPLREADVVWTIASAWHSWMRRFEESEGAAP